MVSLNNDFDVNCRTLSSARQQAQVETVIVLARKDLCDDYEDKVQQVQSLDSMLMIEEAVATA